MEVTACRDGKTGGSIIGLSQRLSEGRAALADGFWPVAL